MPLAKAVQDHVFAAERIHADETTAPVFDPSASVRACFDKTRTGRLWTYVRDERPFADTDLPAAISSTRPTEAMRATRRIRSPTPG